jgi:gluconolactonase
MERRDPADGESSAQTARAKRHAALDRRGFLAAAAGIAAATGMAQEAFARNFGPDAGPQR